MDAHSNRYCGDHSTSALPAAVAIIVGWRFSVRNKENGAQVSGAGARTGRQRGGTKCEVISGPREPRSVAQVHVLVNKLATASRQLVARVRKAIGR